MKTLDQLRDDIDRIDSEVLELLNERMDVVKQVGELKSKTGSAIYRPEREKAIIDRLASLSKGHLNRAAIEAIYLEIFAVSRNLELPERVAYLGPEGTYTHQAAESRFGAMSEYLSMANIDGVFNSVLSGRAKYGVVPIENNTDGIVGETLDMLGSCDLKIVAELFMPIHHTFASACDRLSDIERIYSRDIAFGQCRKFLSEYSLEGVERFPVESTAKAAQLASVNPGSAAICSHIGAKLHQLPILYENIEDSQTNKTRFIIISDFTNQKSGQDKTSVFARIPHSDRPGALANFLQTFVDAGINLTKIESRPMADVRDFSFWFFIDFEGHYDDENVQQVLTRYAEEIKWLGSYAQADIL